MGAKTSAAFIGLLAISASFVFFIIMLTYGDISLRLGIFGAIVAVLFVAYACVYVVAPKRKGLLYAMLGAYAIAFITAFAIEPAIARIVLFSTVTWGFAVRFVLYLVLYMPVIFALFIGAYLLRIAKRKRLAAIAFCITAGLIAVYFLSGAIFQGYHIDDEMYIAFIGAYNLVHGINPYSTNIAPMLYYNRSITGMSVTTTNAIVGVMDYPALFFLSVLPFYFLSQPSLANFSVIDTSAEAMTFILVMFLAVALLIEKRHIKKPPYGLLVILFFAMPIIASIQTYLMFAVLALTYVWLDKKYSWVFLGIAASIQEELWTPVLLLMVYSFMRGGMRTGLKNVAGAALVFLLLNSYFIALSPTAFATSIFSPISKYLFASDTAPIGYLLLITYHMLYGTFMIEFALSLAFVAVLFAYIGRKELVGLFSLVPFLFLQHAIPAYYAFFIIFFVFSFYVARGNANEGAKGTKATHRLRKRYALAMLALIALAMVLVAYNSHQLYAKSFNISVVNQSAYISYNPNSTSVVHYHGELRYSGISNSTLYLAFGATGSGVSGLMGFADSPLISNPVKCNDSYECMINVNRITLNGTSGSYEINANIPFNGNVPAYILEPFLYNGKYFYAAQSVEARGQ